MAGLVGFIIPNRIQPVVLLTKSSFSILLLLLCLHVSIVYLPYQTSSLLHKNHKGLILQCTYSRQTPPLKHTPLVKGPTHEPPHRVTIFYGNSLFKSFLSPANSTGYQRKRDYQSAPCLAFIAFIAPLSRPSHLPSLCCCISLC